MFPPRPPPRKTKFKAATLMHSSSLKLGIQIFPKRIIHSVSLTKGCGIFQVALWKHEMQHVCASWWVNIARDYRYARAPSTGSLLHCHHFLQGPDLLPTPFSPGAELLTEHREGAQDLCGEWMGPQVLCPSTSSHLYRISSAMEFANCILSLPKIRAEPWKNIPLTLKNERFRVGSLALRSMGAWWVQKAWRWLCPDHACSATSFSQLCLFPR